MSQRSILKRVEVKGHARSLDSKNKCTIGIIFDSIFPVMHSFILHTHQFSGYQGHTESLRINRRAHLYMDIFIKNC